LTSVASNTSVTVNTPVLLGASAGDPDGVITNVSFYVNNQLVGSSTKAPYVAFWSPSAPGTYILTAVATDDAGNSTVSLSAGVSALARSGFVPTAGLFFNDPQVDVPAPGATTPATNPLTPVKVSYGSKLILSAPAVDQDGTITNVKFFANGGIIATVNSAPFFTVWQLDTLADVTLTALVTDSSGNAIYTNPILIDTQPSLNAADGAVALVSPLDGSTYGVGGQIIFSATHNFGTANPPKVDFYVDGSQFTTVTAGTGGSASAPYQYIVGLTRPGTYLIHAVARVNNTTTVSFPARITVIANTAPSVSITSPATGGSFVVGNTQTITATAADSDGTIQNVQFFVNGVLLSTDAAAPYTAAWSPGATGTYTLTAKSTDNSGGQTLSAPVTVTITNNAAPVVAITGPASGLNVAGGSNVNLTASASDPDGIVTSVRFVANGNVVGTASVSPFLVAWAPTAAGTYTVVAQATDNAGNVTTSASISVIVTSNQAPVAALIAPGSGAVVRVATGTSLIASASDPDGTIASVQFFANGASVGTATSPTGGSYRVQWLPNSEGVYRITANALDNAGAVTVSATSTILVVASTSSSDVVATGIIVGPGEVGNFAAINARGKAATFIGTSIANGVSKTYFFSGVPLGLNGSFTVADSQGRPTISGTFSDTGAFGGLDNNRVSFSGSVAFPGAVTTVAPGYYSGNLTGKMNSTLAGIVGVDGSIALYVADGGFQAAGFGAVDASGAFNVVTSSGARFIGKADPATGFLTGMLTGGSGGSIMAATSAGSSFSDGFLRNLSTRGPVGTGSNILIAGFVVGGNAPKRILIRAIGPGLTAYGVSGALTDPQLQLFNGSTPLAQNDNWATPVGVGVPDEAAIVSASATVGAFPLAGSSRDAVLLVTLAPGAYSAQVSGVNGAIGIAMVELYDVDSPSAFSAQKLLNVATRGAVGTNQGQLIAGFVISGNTPKKVLIRGVGPSLATVGIPTGFLADPVLRLIRSDNLVVRENDNWEAGNDAALIADASSKVGAFAFSAGSKDAAIMINLPPGAYSAVVGGAGGTTGLALIEVYEAP
ncbi:MAG: Ig-like domain-containing protein, partial [Opitutaceae bacterium]